MCTGRTAAPGRWSPTTTGPRRSRRPPRSSPSSAGPGSRSRWTTSTPAQVGALADRIEPGPRPARRPGERHLGRRGAQGRSGRLGHADLGARPRRGTADPAAGDRHPPDHLAPPAPAARRAAGWAVVEVTDGTTAYNADRYRISVFYDLAKVAVNRLAFSQGHELAPHGGTAVAHHPRLAALRDDAGGLPHHRGDWRDARHGRRAAGAARLRALGVAALRGTGGRGPRRRSRPGPLERAVGRLRARWPVSTGSPTSTAPSPTSGRSSRPPTQPIRGPGRPITGAQTVRDAMPGDHHHEAERANAAERANGTCTSSPSRVRPGRDRAARALHLGAAGARGHRSPLARRAGGAAARVRGRRTARHRAPPPAPAAPRRRSSPRTSRAPGYRARAGGFRPPGGPSAAGRDDASRRPWTPPAPRFRTRTSAVRLIVARCSVTYEGRLGAAPRRGHPAHRPQGRRQHRGPLATPRRTSRSTG